ncbi:MAG TPA: nuclear transport factor 2 family protein [Chthoniobacterales bacterium]
MKRHLLLFAAFASVFAVNEVAAAADLTAPPKASKDEQTIWDLEHSYWHYVDNNDLAAYSNLWHKDFLGWPSVSAAPVHKDQITDWITSETSKGSVFKTSEFKPAAIQVTGDIAVACYWITFSWVDKRGTGPAHTVRITHAWHRTGNNMTTNKNRSRGGGAAIN